VKRRLFTIFSASFLALTTASCARTAHDEATASAITPPTTAPASFVAGFWEGVVGAVVEGVTPILKPMEAICLAALAYRDERGRWPENAQMLEQFADEHDLPFDLAVFESLTLKPMDGGDDAFAIQFVLHAERLSESTDAMRGSLQLRVRSAKELPGGEGR
jgi:hypothetical protein